LGVHRIKHWDDQEKKGRKGAKPLYHLNITALIDAAASDGAEAFYLALIVRPGLCQARPTAAADVAASRSDQ